MSILSLVRLGKGFTSGRLSYRQASTYRPRPTYYVTILVFVYLYVCMTLAHNTALIILAELFNIITKSAEQQSTNRHKGRRHERQEVSVKSDQLSVAVIHQYPTRQHKYQTPDPRVKKKKNLEDLK